MQISWSMRPIPFCLLKLSLLIFIVTIGTSIVNILPTQSYMGISFAKCSDICLCGEGCQYLVYTRRFLKCEIFRNNSLEEPWDKTQGRTLVTLNTMAVSSLREYIDCSKVILNNYTTNMCSFDNFTNSVDGNMRVAGSRIIVKGPLPVYSCADVDIHLECSETGNWIMDWCLMPCFPGRPRDYAGNVSVTENGTSCQRWNSDFPHVRTNLYVDDKRYPDGSMEAAGNKCREPDFRENRTWCYTIDPAVRWEWCDVLIC